MDFLKIAKYIALIPTSFILYKAIRIYLLRRKYRHIPGPPTKGILGYFLGNIIDIQKLISNGKLFPDFYLECTEKYGSVFKVQLIDDIIMFTSDPLTIKELLIVKNYPKSKGFSSLVAYPLKLRLLGNGLITDLDQNRWKHRRGLFNPGFHRSILMTFVNQFNVKADMLLERLRLFSDGKTIVSLFKELNHATLDAIAQIAFGMNIDSINQKDTELRNAVAYILKILDESFRDPFIRFRPDKADKRKEFTRCVNLVRNIGRELLVERIQALKNRDHVPTDILSSILHNWTDEDMDMESMVDDFVTFFIAGQETTANTLAFCFMEIGRNDDIFKKAREEVDRVLGERNEITYQDAVDLKYCSCIFKEALRLYPPAPVLDRFILDDLIINGYKIPKNSIFHLSSYVNARNPKYFPDPLEFKPERFVKDRDSFDNSKEKENYTYFPFSLGPRNCIGQNFAQIEGVIMIGKLIKNFDYILEPNQSFEVAQDLTLHPRDGTKCIFKLRN